MAPPDPRDRLIVALDVDSLAQAERLAERLDGLVRRFKIGSQLFTAGGPAVVEAIQKRGAEVFLDLKFHDIPNTVAGAAREAARLGVFMFNVHASGGLAMMKAAADGAAAAAKELFVRRPLAIAVTVLTSLDRAALHRELGVASSVEGHVLRLSELAREAGLDGTVASPVEIAAIRRSLGAAWVIVTPIMLMLVFTVFINRLADIDSQAVIRTAFMRAKDRAGGVDNSRKTVLPTCIAA